MCGTLEIQLLNFATNKQPYLIGFSYSLHNTFHYVKKLRYEFAFAFACSGRNIFLNDDLDIKRESLLNHSFNWKYDIISSLD